MDHCDTARDYCNGQPATLTHKSYTHLWWQGPCGSYQIYRAGPCSRERGPGNRGLPTTPLISCFHTGNTWPKHNHQLGLWHMRAERGNWAFVCHKFFQFAYHAKLQNSTMNQMKGTTADSLLMHLETGITWTCLELKSAVKMKWG